MKKFIKGNYKLILGIVIGIVLSYLLLSKDKELKNDVEKISNTNNTEEVELGDTATYFDSINVHYDNTSSGLTNDTVKEAIDELYDIALQKECKSGYIKLSEIDERYVCGPPPICKRAAANTLHTETCPSSSICAQDGYVEGNLGTTITYGNTSTTPGQLTTGDAFDCNVDGTGYNKRFYYISPYFNTDTKTFDDEDGYAVLVYYATTYYDGSSVIKDAGRAPAYSTSAGENWNGPTVAINSLPTEEQWSNVKLKTTTKAILAERLTTHNSPTVTHNGTTYTLPTAFSYAGRAARLLTAQELMQGCGLTQVGTRTAGEVTARCKFLCENSRYVYSNTTSTAQFGRWLETPLVNNVYSLWFISCGPRYVYDESYNMYRGVLPVIDVPTRRIEY